MKSTTLSELIAKSTCQVYGWEEASNDAQRTVVARLAANFRSPDTLVLCEPSLARSTKRPPDVVLIDAELVLGFSRSRIEAIGGAAIRGSDRLHVSVREQDQLLGASGQLSLSTTASAKGYDAYCVLLASGNEFPRDAAGRISFYVGCTRAIEYLEVFAYRKEGFVSEFERILGRQKEITGD